MAKEQSVHYDVQTVRLITPMKDCIMLNYTVPYKLMPFGGNCVTRIISDYTEHASTCCMDMGNEVK